MLIIQSHLLSMFLDIGSIIRGLIFSCSANLARNLLSEDFHVVFSHLNEKINFDIVIGIIFINF